MRILSTSVFTERSAPWLLAAFIALGAWCLPSTSLALVVPERPTLVVSQPQAHVFKAGTAANVDAQAAQRKPDGVYLNARPAPERSLLWGFKMGMRYFFQSQPDTAPAPGSIAVQALTPAAIAAAPTHTFWRLGHSSVLLKMAMAICG